MADPSDMPKIELHRHLEGSVRPSTILELAREHSLPLPAGDLPALKKAIYVTEPVADIRHVFERFRLAQQTFVGPRAIERVAREVVEDAAADRILLLELRFSPSFMTEIHPTPWDEVLDAVKSGVSAARAAVEIEVGLIVIVSRDLGLERCEETVDFALEHRASVAGLDLAGDETNWPARRFAAAFRRAAAEGMRITVHAGEVAGPSEIEDALTLLHADRIGHGVSIARSPTLLTSVIEAGIPLEMCPTSNVMTRSVDGFASHPLPTLLRAGARVTVSSDDPEIFGIRLGTEYRTVMNLLGLTVEELETTNRHALAASFLPAASIERAARRFAPRS